MFSIPIAIIRKKNLPYLSICQEIYFSFKHHTPGVYGNHKTSHSDEEAEAISSAINIFNFCLQHEKKLKSFLNLNPKCCLIVHIWLGLFRRNKSCWCQQCVQWHINLAYPGEHRGHGKGVWQVQLCGNIATGTGFLIFLQSAQDKCFPNSSLFKHNKAKERERERDRRKYVSSWDKCLSLNTKKTHCQGLLAKSPSGEDFFTVFQAYWKYPFSQC